MVAALPSDTLTPETTANREGFIHIHEFTATISEATVTAMVRDFEDDLLAEHIALLRQTAEQIVASEPRAHLTIYVKPQYPNMRHYLAEIPQSVTAADRAIRAEGLTPVRDPIRGAPTARDSARWDFPPITSLQADTSFIRCESGFPYKTWLPQQP